MVPVTLGRSGLSASPIGLGLAAIGRPAYINLRPLDMKGHAALSEWCIATW